MPRRYNITGRNTTSNGLKLNTGLGTMCDFNLVTAVENKETNLNVRFRFPSSANTLNDYFSDVNHHPQFKSSAGAIISDGGNYNNNWSSARSQMIVSEKCYLKSVSGFISPQGASGCTANIVLSVWKKPTNADSTSSTAITLLFSQSFTFVSKANSYVSKVDGRTDARVNDSTRTIDADDAIIVTIRRTDEETCGNFDVSMGMVFKSTESQATTDDFKFNTISSSFQRYDQTLSNPDRAYKKK
jgi:hypothetical protein|tara:strand:- start:19851 stop:20579 length:729 start_codon:yes stop_codon:yes gene_type:complete